MKKTLWLIAALIVVIGLAACGNAASNIAGSTSTISEPKPEPLSQATLTGLERGSDYVEDRRITAVMVNNIDLARPTRGLSQADVLVEIVVEGGITRFMALYADYEQIPQVGTFRSARDQFFQLILPYQALYAHVGESTKMSQYFKDYEYEDYNVDGNTDGKLWWVADRPGYSNQEYRSYTSGERITDYIKRHNLDDKRTYNSTIFNFTQYDQDPRELSGEKVQSFTVTHSYSYRTSFEYNASAAKYDMSQYASNKGATMPTIDENNEQQLAFENVIIIFATMNAYPGDSGGVMQVHYNEGGMGYYFNGGRYEIIRWSKDTPMQALAFFDAEGNEIPVEINPGKTYLAVVDNKYLENFFNQIEEMAAPPVSSSVSGQSA